MSDENPLEALADSLLDGEEMTQEERQWHLDKKVIVALIFGFISLFLASVGNTAYIAIYVTEWKTATDDQIAVLKKDDEAQQSQEGRIVALEKSDQQQEDAIKKSGLDEQSNDNRVTILEQQLPFIRADLTEIKELLKRQIPTGKSP